MNNFDTFLRHLSAVFIQLPDFVKIDTKEEIFIIDFKGQTYIEVGTLPRSISRNGTPTEISDFEFEKHFRIVNHKKKTGFLPIDGKHGLLGFGVSHCDFTFFDEYDFCFVELKLNATSLQESAIRKNRYKAIEQLGNTIALFDKKLNADYKGLKLEAYISTPHTYPRSDSTWASMAVAFLEKQGIPLFELNYKKCK